jgi:ATPase complex subunit ATP10
MPKPLGRPIGFPHPPKAGQNIGEKTKKVYKGKTMSERNLEKREELMEEWSQNHFRDFKMARKYRKGKVFMANPKIFRKEAALYFPNFRGTTLAGNEADTTPTLKGKLNVVNVYSSRWGEEQARSFTGARTNPGLKELLEKNKDLVQMVDINIEENPLKGIVLMFTRWYARRMRTKEECEKYFIVSKGVSDRLREGIGLLNGRVGYVYLLDEDAKIRWAGSGDAEGTEMEDMNSGLTRLIEHTRNPSKRKTSQTTQKPEKPEVEQELEAQAVNAGAS